MLFATIGQFRVFLWMLAAGAVSALWYALRAGLRRLLRAGLWLSLAADIAFGVGAAAIFILALYTANYGAVRFYAVLAALLGFGLCAAGVYPPGRRCCRALARGLCHIFITIRRNRWINVIFK